VLFYYLEVYVLHVYNTRMFYNTLLMTAGSICDISVYDNSSTNNMLYQLFLITPYRLSFFFLLCSNKLTNIYRFCGIYRLFSINLNMDNV